MSFSVCPVCMCPALLMTPSPSLHLALQQSSTSRMAKLAGPLAPALLVSKEGRENGLAFDASLAQVSVWV